MIETLTEELSYLVSNKKVSISKQLENHQVTLPNTAAKIVLSNIIRNAFQHTWAGQVFISQHQNQVLIINRCEHFDTNNQNDQLGFGLGLRLTEELCEKLGCDYSNEQVEVGHQVKLTFK